MSFLNFGKKKEEKQTRTCCCGGSSASANEVKNTCCGKETEGICCIRVLGAGCKSCHEQYENVKKAVAELGLSVEVEYITDMEKVTSYGVMSMPAIVVNEKVVSMGKVLKTADVVKLLAKAGA
ncbi:MAG: thioredoxin family protein [Porcipelethomonas sp.]